MLAKVWAGEWLVVAGLLNLSTILDVILGGVWFRIGYRFRRDFSRDFGIKNFWLFAHRLSSWVASGDRWRSVWPVKAPARLIINAGGGTTGLLVEKRDIWRQCYRATLWCIRSPTASVLQQDMRIFFNGHDSSGIVFCSCSLF